MAGLMFRIYGFTLGPLLVALTTLTVYYLFKRARNAWDNWWDERHETTLEFRFPLYWLKKEKERMEKTTNGT